MVPGKIRCSRDKQCLVPVLIFEPGLAGFIILEAIGRSVDAEGIVRW